MTQRKQIKQYAAGEKHPFWRGEAVGYKPLHAWLNANYPRTGRCEWCGRTDRPTEYASDGRYTRNRADWFEMCRICHMYFDGRHQLSQQVRAKISAATLGRRKTADHAARIGAARRALFVDRDRQIRSARLAGESVPVLARRFGLTESRIYQIVPASEYAKA